MEPQNSFTHLVERCSSFRHYCLPDGLAVAGLRRPDDKRRSINYTHKFSTKNKTWKQQRTTRTTKSLGR